MVEKSKNGKVKPMGNRYFSSLNLFCKLGWFKGIHQSCWILRNHAKSNRGI